LKTNSFSNHLPYVAFQLIKNGNLELGNQIIDDYISKTSEYYGNELNTYRNKLIKSTSYNIISAIVVSSFGKSIFV
jgi:hypothetical protein